MSKSNLHFVPKRELESFRYIRAEIQLKIQKQTQLKQEKEKIFQKIQLKNEELRKAEELLGKLQENVKNLENEIQRLEEELRRLIGEHDQCVAQLEKERKKLQELEQELINEITQLNIAERAVKEQRKQKRAAEQALRKCEFQEAQARKQELLAKLDEVQARAHLEDVRIELNLAIVALMVAQATNQTVDSIALAKVAKCKNGFSGISTKRISPSEFRQCPNSTRIWTTLSNFYHCRISYGNTTMFSFAGNFIVHFPSELGQYVRFIFLFYCRFST